MKMSVIAIRIGIGLSILGTSCISGQVVPTPWPTSTPIATVVEPGLAYGDPCRPPCWRGLIPGRSSGQDAKQAIDQLRASGWATYIGGDPGELYHIEPGSMIITIKDNSVERILGQVTFYYPVETMIEQFGEPEGLYIVRGSVPQGTCDEWKSPDPLMAPVGDIQCLHYILTKGSHFLSSYPTEESA